jgi:tetratricopeptide (TPR) repeat protein
MRFVLPIIVLAACGNRVAKPTTPAPIGPVEIPAHDLAVIKDTAPPAPGDGHLIAKDPRVVDLDIIRITATQKGVGGDHEMTSVATADIFKKANEAVKAKRTEEAIGLFRQIVKDFPESKYAPVSLFNIAAIYDGRGDPTSTITTLRELVQLYPNAREAIDGELYIAALQSEHQQWTDAITTLDDVAKRDGLTYNDRIEMFARKGYAQLELKQVDTADATLELAVAEWRKAPHVEDPYYIAMAHYYRGEIAHRKFTDAPVRLPDDQLVADLEAKRVLAVQAYDRWKESLGFKHAYWATASGYQMSQIFVELWQITVTAPYPKKIETQTRPKYVAEVHDRVREHLSKALEGHRMNVELAKAFGVDTTWSKGSEQRAVEIMSMLARDAAGQYVTPAN